MRLIDADELLTKEHQHYDYLADEWLVPVRDIEDAPTIDAVEVVRCKDCKWGDRHGTTDEGKPYYYCVITDWAGQPPEFFCANGEREEKTDE